MDNKVFLLGLFLLSVANVKAQTQTQNDSLTMENMMHNLPEIMVKGSRPMRALKKVPNFKLHSLFLNFNSCPRSISSFKSGILFWTGI